MMPIIVRGRFGACLLRASLAAVILRRWRWPERFCTYAEQSADPADGPVGDRLVGVALLALGDPEGARRHVARTLGRYVARKSHIVRFQYDQRLLACSYHSLILRRRDLPILRCMASSAFWSTLAPAITGVAVERSQPRRVSRRRSHLSGTLLKGAHGSFRQAHAGAVEPRGPMLRRRVARRARRGWSFCVLRSPASLRTRLASLTLYSSPRLPTPS
jgi:hypothetical protein